jgi:menaquinone-dependent protoporphyrinogen oxidase
MKILVVYGSEYGQAEAVVRRIAEALTGRGHQVSIHRANAIPSGTAVDDFDAILVAASIVMGRYQAYVRDFVRTHVGTLRRIPTAFVSVNGHSPESDPEWQSAARRYVERFLEETSWRPRWTATFSGALRYPRYGLLTRWIMKRISAYTGGPTDTHREYEFTDWAAVDRFAAELGEALAPQPAVVT